MRLLIFFFFTFSLLSPVFAQSYQELSEQALELADKDSLEQAEKLFREALKLEPANPRNSMLFSNIGMLQYKMKKYEEALESYTLALNIAPYAVPILLNRAAVFMETGQADRAYVDYCQVFDLDKTNKEALLMRAYICMARRDYPTARMDYDRLLREDPANYTARLGLINLNQKEQKYKAALEIANKMLTEYPEDAVLYLTRAGIEQDMEHPDLALVDLEEAIRLQPDSPEGYIIRGELYLSQRKKALAKADFEKAVSLGTPVSELREQLLQCR